MHIVSSFLANFLSTARIKENPAIRQATPNRYDLFFLGYYKPDSPIYPPWAPITFKTQFQQVDAYGHDVWHQLVEKSNLLSTEMQTEPEDFYVAL